MFIAAALTLFLQSSTATVPNKYNEKWLCDLWAGAQCHATRCQKDGRERCEAVSKQCVGLNRDTSTDQARAERKAACAKALLKQTCGTPKPAECDGQM
jgi:hypothetical protein